MVPSKYQILCGHPLDQLDSWPFKFDHAGGLHGKCIPIQRPVGMDVVRVRRSVDGVRERVVIESNAIIIPQPLRPDDRRDM